MSQQSCFGFVDRQEEVQVLAFRTKIFQCQPSRSIQSHWWTLRKPYPDANKYLTDKAFYIRIQKVNSHIDKPIKAKEYDLLEAISKDSTITQSGLASHLGIAVGSVNWYIKRLINRGYVKVSRMDRTRLKYDLTSEGLQVLTQRAINYMKDSLAIYNELRGKAKKKLLELEKKSINSIYLEGDSTMLDILRLTCIERGISLDQVPEKAIIKTIGKDYHLIIKDNNASLEEE